MDGGTIFHDNSAGFDLWQVIFKDLSGIGDGNGDDRTSGFRGHLKTPFFEWLYLTICTPGSFRENADGDTGLNIVYAGFDHLQTCTYIRAVKKQAVKPLHPISEKRIPEHLGFGHISGQTRALGIGEQDVEIAVVIAHIEDCLVLWNIFSANVSNMCSSEPQNQLKSCLHHAQAADIAEMGVPPADQPFDQKYGDAKEQIEQKCQGNQYKTYHAG